MKKYDYKFMDNRKKLFTIAIAVLVIMFVISLIRGYELDIEFKGGSLLEYSYTGEVSDENATSSVQSATDKPVNCQISKNLADGSTKIVVSVASKEPLSTEELAAISDALESDFPDNEIELSNSLLVSPTLGREMLSKGLKALVVASVLIIAYVWYSFRKMSGPSAGVMALVALTHDALLAFFAFVIMGSAINETVIAVILTILGFSINDTIVVYDRIRENKRLHSDKHIFDIVDMSLNQTIRRTATTSLCIFIAVLVAYIFALSYDIGSIEEFALPILVGIVAGTYSSICLSSPLWALWVTRDERRETKKA